MAKTRMLRVLPMDAIDRTIDALTERGVRSSAIPVSSRTTGALPAGGDLADALRGVLHCGAADRSPTPKTALRWHLHASGLDPAVDVDLLDIGLLEVTWGPPLTNWPAEVGPMGNTILESSATTAEEQDEVVERFLDALEGA